MIDRSRVYPVLAAGIAVAADQMSKAARGLVGYGLAFIMAGATGNALDRIFHGSVVDFLDASKIGFAWIFNLADATIDLGIALVVLGSLRPRRDAIQTL